MGKKARHALAGEGSALAGEGSALAAQGRMQSRARASRWIGGDEEKPTAGLYAGGGSAIAKWVVSSTVSYGGVAAASAS